MQKLIGQKVRITLKNTSPVLSGPLAHTEKPTYDLEGTVMLRPHWEKDSDYFALAIPHTTPPLRMIHIRTVLAVNGFPMEQPKQKSAEQIFKIKSSRGNEVYTVKEFDGFWTCTCVANSSFRKLCRHIKEAKGE